MSQDQGLFAGVERGQHRSQVGPAADAGEDRVDISLVVQLTGNACPDLRQDFGVDAAGTLIDDQQRDVELAELPRDRAKRRLAGRVRIEKLVRFFDCDHQRSWTIRLVLRIPVALGFLDPQLMQPSGDDVGRQNVREKIALPAKLQHHVLAALELSDDLVERGACKRALHEWEAIVET